MSLIDIDITPSSHKKPSSQASSMHRSKSERKPPRQRKYVPDTIDRLDGSFGSSYYHHQGPYEAALRSYNKYSKYAPLAATEEGNKAAWAATPREAQIDALRKGRPLDNVAVIPPGQRAMNGQVMNYDEGADLMREPDAEGGPYKRWPGLEYHPDDLKGKGMPGFRIENLDKQGHVRRGRSVSVNDSVSSSSRKRGSSAAAAARRGEYEMLMVGSRPGDRASRNGYLMVPRQRDYDDEPEQGDESQKHTGARVVTRERSASAAAGTSSSRPKEFAEGLKRRIGSLRRR